jgi:hypothetical protein
MALQKGVIITPFSVFWMLNPVSCLLSEQGFYGFFPATAAT